MSTESQRDQARKIRDAFIALGGIPSSLRSPLAAVQNNCEEMGTAKQILRRAIDALVARAKRCVS